MLEQPAEVKRQINLVNPFFLQLLVDLSGSPDKKSEELIRLWIIIHILKLFKIEIVFGLSLAKFKKAFDFFFVHIDRILIEHFLHFFDVYFARRIVVDFIE